MNLVIITIIGGWCTPLAKGFIILITIKGEKRENIYYPFRSVIIIRPVSVIRLVHYVDKP